MTIFIGLFSLLSINIGATNNIYLLLAKNFSAVGSISTLVFFESLILPFLEGKTKAKVFLAIIAIASFIAAFCAASLGSQIK